ncbi:hypothetical protein KQ874_03005 [Mycoplasma sp. ES3157-GEN-MYC]|uniref:Mbov_0396 family ICE element transmembrane protein n=1 Tax=Mycoplasma miroungigenitalium TaxID=754515 RepID=UPI001C0FEE62|nr:hypothetical protein [Mycoplasma miroungigenitalium]MBU4690646.1 hypothetical protein [Mycoplasma miroungigenitalium]
MFGLLQTIAYGIFCAFWYVLVYMPAWILHIVSMTLEFIALKLPIYLIFGGYEINFSSPFFTKFIIISFLCVIFVIGIVFYKFLKASKSPEAQLNFKDSIKRAMLAFILIFGIPILIWVISIFVVILYDFTKTALGLDSNTTLSNYIFKVLEPKFKYPQYHTEWISTQNTFQPITKNAFIALDTNFLLLIIELFVSIIAILWVIINLFLRVIKTTSYQFIYFLWLPPAITQAISDNGISLKNWFKKYTECALSTFIILICLILFGFLIEITFEQLPKLIVEIISSSQLQALTEPISTIASILILIGMTFGMENMTTKIMEFFNLHEFAQPPVKLKVPKNKQSNQQTKSTDKKSKTANTRVSSDKNALAKTNTLKNKNIPKTLNQTKQKA